MRVTKLTMQGYKSFATKHEFVFPEGITAIIGPNGSGKSNIADAVRWVLGEQRPTSLRAKKTEDLIFAGTERRPRAGMAEVNLTIDNSDGALDVDFSEVVITRRAHRDGVNDYEINGARVRLRDILDLLGSQLGQSDYTVIGQGLVDQALALSPSDRRVLIDEAAGIVPLQRRRDRTLRRMDETQDNLTRVRDILEEIAPRLRRMRRLSERAARHRELSAELEERLGTWYGYQWHRALEGRAAARREVETLREAVEAARERVEARAAALKQAEAADETAGEQLSTWRAERKQLAAAVADARQAAAVARARLEGLRTQREEQSGTSEALAEERRRLERRATSLDEEIAELEEEHAARKASTTAAREALAEAEREVTARAEALEEARAALFEHRSQLTDRRQRLEHTGEQLDARRTALAEAEAERDAVAEKRPAVEADLASARAAVERADDALAEVRSAADAAEAELESGRSALAAARDRQAEARSALEALRTRSGALDALFGEVYGGGRLMEALRAADVDGVVGTVARLLAPERGWDAAVSVALGPRLDAVVVRDADALRAALDALDDEAKRTLVALEDSARHRTWTAEPGVRRAADVAAAPDAPALVEALLGDTAFVPDLEAARQALAAADGPARAATRDGYLVRRGGAVTWGTPGEEVLELERERRALPDELDDARRALEAAAADVDRLAEQRRALEGRLGDLADARAAAEQTRSKAVERLESAEAARERIEREHSWKAEAVTRLADEIAALEAQQATLSDGIASSEPKVAAAAERVDALREAHGAVDLSPQREAVSAAEAALSETAQALAGRRAMRHAVADDLAALEARATRAEQRTTQLADEIAALEATAAEREREAAERGDALETLDARIAPAEAAAAERRERLRALAAELEDARRMLGGKEERLAEARVAAARAEDRLERLYDQLRSDSEWIPAVEELPQQLTLGEELEPALGVPLPAVTELPSGLEKKIGQLRRQLRSVGSIDAEALEAFEETVERHDFLREQEADLEAAEADLRTALETLEAEMAERYEATFAAVAEAFSAAFPRLFGGGEAELTSRDEDGQAGIEITARPPGKRRQPLSLLSGGERALTGVALVFALLRVSETPFVVLDEVDAALDEANIDRFRGTLEDLANEVQVVIITHNRGTVQTASTVYGVSMGDDGASQVLSLRVDEAA